MSIIMICIMHCFITDMMRQTPFRSSAFSSYLSIIMVCMIHTIIMNRYELNALFFYDWHDEIESFQKQIHLGQKWFRYPYCALHACSWLRIVLLRTKNLDILGTLYHGGSVVYGSYCLWFMVRMTEFWWLVAWQDSSCGNWKLIFCLFCFSVSCASEVYIIILYIIYICLLMLSL